MSTFELNPGRIRPFRQSHTTVGRPQYHWIWWILAPHWAELIGRLLVFSRIRESCEQVLQATEQGRTISKVINITETFARAFSKIERASCVVQYSVNIKYALQTEVEKIRNLQLLDLSDNVVSLRHHLKIT